MSAVLAAMVAATAAGLAWHRRAPEAAGRGAQAALTAILWVLAPFVIVFTLPHLEADGALRGGLALGYAAVAVSGLLAWVVATRLLRLERAAAGTVICATVVVNTGYFGLPFTTALLGRDDLPAAIAYDALVSGPMFYVAGFAIGAAFGAAPALTGRARARRTVLRNPPLIAAIAGLLLPASAAPAPLVDAAHAAVWGLLVLGFLALGVTLSAEAREGALAFPPRLDPPVAAVVALRLAVAPALFLGLTALAGGAPPAFRVEAAMPVGLNTLVVAHATGLDLRVAASAIAWTTAAVAAWGLVASAS